MTAAPLDTTDINPITGSVASAERSSLPRKHYDVIVIGAGVAGLAFTLSLPPELRVALLTKGVLGESNTRYAQGGLSAAVGADDSPALHAVDTLAAGAGLSEPEAVAQLVEVAPVAVRWLVALGAHFDAGPNGEILLGREAAHSRRRVLHAGGDATGAEIERALVARVREDRNVDLYPGAFVVDLVVTDGRCRGVLAELEPGGPLIVLSAPVTVLAAGGAGHVWATTSNPEGATADGLAMALRAGATVADTEFVQFHPTVLAIAGSTPFLVSEAVRGEGAYLRDRNGNRFMFDQHPLAELAPRDVVARGIQRQMALNGVDHVHLDLRHLDAHAMRERFPTIARELARRGLDLAFDLIPVAPAAHYFMGGIVAGTDGVTSLPGLLALGEAACTGVHGANRLASNSLLEGLVFGLKAAANLGSTVAQPAIANSPAQQPRMNQVVPKASSDLNALIGRVQRTMSRNVAVVRDVDGLSEAAAELDDVLSVLMSNQGSTRAAREAANLTLAARAVISAATLREESRSDHSRRDF